MYPTQDCIANKKVLGNGEETYEALLISREFFKHIRKKYGVMNNFFNFFQFFFS